MKKTMLFCVVIGWASVAWSANWVSLGTGSQGNLAIDETSIVRNGDLVHYWLRQILPAPQLDAGTGRMYQRLQVFRHMNCRAQTSAIQIEQVYAPDGSLISTSSEPDPSNLEYREIKPHTMGAAEMRHVCRSARNAALPAKATAG